MFSQLIFFKRGGGLSMGVLGLGNQSKFETTGNQQES